MSTLSSLIFKGYRRRALALLLLHPGEAYYVREIARLTNTVAGTLHKELSRLSEAGVLLKEAKGNQLLYRANRDCPIYEELASILRKTAAVVDVLAEALAPLEEKIRVALVLGSMASGKENSASDVDVLIIGSLGFTEAVKAFYPAQEVLSREINPNVYNDREWGQMRDAGNLFIKEIMEKPKLFIVGVSDDLG